MLGHKGNTRFHSVIHHIVPLARGGPKYENWNLFTGWIKKEHQAWHQLFHDLLPSTAIDIILHRWTLPNGGLDWVQMGHSKSKAWKIVFDDWSSAQAIEFIEKNFLPAEKRFFRNKKGG